MVGIRKEEKEDRVVYSCSTPLVDSDSPLVSIVTTAYKNERFNRKYFSTVNAQTYRNVEVIFVDNVSPDSTVKDAIRRLKRGKIVSSKTNTGCAGGNNMGVLEASGKYIFLLGPDTWIDERCIEALMEAVEKGPGNIYTSRQMTYDGNEFISCGIASDFFGYPARTYTRDGSKQLKKVFYADGTNVFMARESYLNLGMMDDSTFLFAEDVGLSWKAHMFGMNVIPVYDSIVYHYSGGSVGIGGYPKGERYKTNIKRRFLAERNIIRNILKYYRWWNVPWIIVYYFLVNIFEMISMLITGQWRVTYQTYLKAYLWNIKNISSTLEKRKFVQKNRVVGDWEIMRLMSWFPHKFLALLELGVPKVN